MGTEVWILKCPKLISNTEKQRLKIQSSVQTLKNTILKNHKNTKKLRNIYEVHFKNRDLYSFGQYIVGYKNEN